MTPPVTSRTQHHKNNKNQLTTNMPVKRPVPFSRTHITIQILSYNIIPTNTLHAILSTASATANYQTLSYLRCFPSRPRELTSAGRSVAALHRALQGVPLLRGHDAGLVRHQVGDVVLQRRDAPAHVLIAHHSRRPVALGRGNDTMSRRVTQVTRTHRKSFWVAGGAKHAVVNVGGA